MSKLHILLVYPEIPETYWSMRRAIRLVGKRSLMPPLGLLTIAAYFPEEAFEFRLADLNVRGLRDTDLDWADLALVSAMLVQRESFHVVLARCRSRGLATAVGGPYPTACRGEMGEADCLVLGEAELAMPEFIADLLSGRLAPVYEERGKPALGESPVPRFDLVRVRDYSMMPVQFSRGCPYACEFCDITALFGRKVRTKEPERFLLELDALLAAGAPENVFVVDDNFIGDRKRARTLLRALVSWQEGHGRPFTMSTEASIDLASDEELMDLMVAANFEMVFVGLETPHADSLASTGKKQNLRLDPVAAIAILQRKGLQVTGGFIVGFDTDPPDICDLQASFVKRLAMPVAMVGLLTALPGTLLSTRLEREGRLISESNGNNTHDTVFNFRTVLPSESLVAGYHWLIGEIYRPRVYFDRCIELLRRLRDGGRRRKRSRISLRPTDLVYLVKSLTLQTFSRYGLDYLRYLRKALAIGPRFLREIITLAVQGRHFFKITEMTLARWNSSRPA